MNILKVLTILQFVSIVLRRIYRVVDIQGYIIIHSEYVRLIVLDMLQFYNNND